MRLCKFVSFDRTTQAPSNSDPYLTGNTRIFWEDKKTYQPRPLKPAEKYSLCSDTVLHAFFHPAIGEVMLDAWGEGYNSSSASYRILLEVTGTVVSSEGLQKFGCSEITVIREIPRVITKKHRDILLWILLRFRENNRISDWEKYLENPGKMQKDAGDYLLKLPIQDTSYLLGLVAYAGSSLVNVLKTYPSHYWWERLLVETKLLQLILDKFQEHYGTVVKSRPYWII